ncbi:TetR/AcrR family transcriptional regulator [Dysgonomonas sp. OttesenSCG-928-M03]|nr:TetR/AcrR family transcriptional regulator [Dysgonomonas sp. OttesenSCG-928-M03]
MATAKEKILEKAFNLFLLNSYDSVTMQQIQEASEVSRGAIYHHFKSKEEIFNAVVKIYLLPAFSSYSMISDEEKKSLQELIYASIKYRQSHINLLKDITSFKLTDFYFFKFIFQATENYKEFTEQVNLLTEKEFNGWRNVIQTAMRTGEIRPDIDLDYTAQMFIVTPLGLGIFSAFSNYININTKDIRTSYLRLYSLLKKPGFG